MGIVCPGEESIGRVVFSLGALLLRLLDSDVVRRLLDGGAGRLLEGDVGRLDGDVGLLLLDGSAGRLLEGDVGRLDGDVGRLLLDGDVRLLLNGVVGRKLDVFEVRRGVVLRSGVLF